MIFQKSNQTKSMSSERAMILFKIFIFSYAPNRKYGNVFFEQNRKYERKISIIYENYKKYMIRIAKFFQK